MYVKKSSRILLFFQSFSESSFSKTLMMITKHSGLLSWEINDSNDSNCILLCKRWVPERKLQVRQVRKNKAFFTFWYHSNSWYRFMLLSSFCALVAYNDTILPSWKSVSAKRSDFSLFKDSCLQLKLRTFILSFDLVFHFKTGEETLEIAKWIPRLQKKYHNFFKERRFQQF